MAGLGIKTDLPIHVFDQLLADRQAQARPALLAAIGRVGLGELLKYSLAEIVSDPRPLVSDAYPHPSVTHHGR